jgi:hypothetical protein
MRCVDFLWMLSSFVSSCQVVTNDYSMLTCDALIFLWIPCSICNNFARWHAMQLSDISTWNSPSQTKVWEWLTTDKMRISKEALFKVVSTRFRLRIVENSIENPHFTLCSPKRRFGKDEQKITSTPPKRRFGSIKSGFSMDVSPWFVAQIEYSLPWKVDS